MASSRAPAKRAPARRTVTITDEHTPSIVVPRGRTAAERRLAALAALHQPIPRHYPTDRVGSVVLSEAHTVYVCGECKTQNDMTRVVAARWPCTTARLMGVWPGEPAP